MKRFNKKNLMGIRTDDVAIERGKIIAKYINPYEREMLMEAMEAWMNGNKIGVDVQVSFGDGKDTVGIRDISYIVFQNLRETTNLRDKRTITDDMYGFRHKYTVELYSELLKSEHPAVWWDGMEQSFKLDDRIREVGEHWADGLCGY